MPQLRKSPVAGTRPQGTSDRDSAARVVRQMFTSIAPRYDLVNHVISFRLDRVWWRRAARTFRHVLARNDARVLDICCGTGDMAFALKDCAGQSGVHVYGADFSHTMLRLAAHKAAGTDLRWIEADALRLPVGDGEFDLVTSAFGFRNLADYDAGLQEIFRVLRRGGEVGILDFGDPKGAFGVIYRIYFHRVLPLVGTWISGVKGPYSYLPASVERFPPAEEMLERMRAAGFSKASWTPYTFGVVGLYRAKK